MFKHKKIYFVCKNQILRVLHMFGSEKRMPNHTFYYDLDEQTPLFHSHNRERKKKPQDKTTGVLAWHHIYSRPTFVQYTNLDSWVVILKKLCSHSCKYKHTSMHACTRTHACTHTHTHTHTHSHTHTCTIMQSATHSPHRKDQICHQMVAWNQSSQLPL